MEVNDLCHEMATMICDKKDNGEVRFSECRSFHYVFQEELGLRYLNELEKDRSPLVNRVFKFEAKNIACESRRMVIQLGRGCSTFTILRGRGKHKQFEVILCL